MLFMIIEQYRDPGSATVIYDRARERGRMLPSGLTYRDSWLEVNGRRCFQLMECDDAQLLLTWTANWSDVVDFTVVPVVTSAQAAAVFAGG
jgi:hypothetical protein